MSDQQLGGAEFVDNQRLSTGNMDAELSMHATTLQTYYYTKVDRQPLRVYKMNQYDVLTRRYTAQDKQHCLQIPHNVECLARYML